VLIGLSYLLGQLTPGRTSRSSRISVAAATDVFGLFIAIFIGIGLVSKEVERRSIYALLPSRSAGHSSSSGKYAGLVLTLRRQRRRS
jgi:ABC-type transport system involved in multi-copper enzyme maturation permease subunit